MTTTHLFVELLVIGFGALAWLAILGAAVFGYDFTPLLRGNQSWVTLLPLLSLVYVLGILIDRMADWAFDRLGFDARHRKAHFGEDRDAYFAARRTLVVHGPALWEHLEYGRSRLRICRGWALNALMLLVAVDALALVRRAGMLAPWWRLVVCNLFFFALSALCIACWWALNQKEYRKIQRQSAWIEKMKKQEESSDG